MDEAGGDWLFSSLFFSLHFSRVPNSITPHFFVTNFFFFLQRDRGKKHTHIHSLLCFFILLSLFSSRRIIRSVSIPFRWKRRGWKFICLFFYWSVCYSSVSLFFSFSFVCVKPNAQLFRFVFFYCFFFCTCVSVIQLSPSVPTRQNSLARPYLKLSQFNLQYSEPISLYLSCNLVCFFPYSFWCG